MEQVSKIKYWFLCLVPFVMCTYPFWAAYVIIGYFLCWLIEGELKTKMQRIKSNRYVLLFVGFYVLNFIGILYTMNSGNGWFNLQVKLSLLLFPLLLSGEGLMDIKKLKLIMYSFIAGCVVNGLVCIGNAIFKLVEHNIFEFQYKQLSILMHTSYFSMYIDVALLFIFYLFTSNSSVLSKVERIILLSSVFFLAFMLVLLQSKMGMAISVCLILLLLVKHGKMHGYKVSGIVLAGIAVIYLLAVHFVIGDHSRIEGAVNTVVNTTVTASSVESTQARSIVWKAALQVIEKHPIIGVGTGSADSVLVKQYLQDGYTGVAKEHLNTHNQYLQTTVILGVIGLLSLLVCFVFPFIVCVKEKRFIYGAFLVIVAANFLVESMLEVQSGTIFYGMFNSLLMFNFVI